MRIAIAIAMTSAALAAGCGNDASSDDPDAAPGADGGPTIDAGPGADADDPDDLCGQRVTDVAGITGTEGLAIGDDGTLYYSQAGAVGRVQPGQARQDGWAKLDGAGDQIWGLALTDAHVYVGYPDDDSIWRVDRATGDAERWLEDAGSPNGVVIGGDGALYYSDFSGGQVYRVDLDTAQRTQVTDPTPERGQEIRQPNGLFAVDAEHLLVLAYGAGEVWELTLADGVETARTPRATVDGALDGITRGPDGRWYLTDNSGDRVVRRPADFEAPSGEEDVLSGAPIDSAANLVFGRGALACNHLYVTSSGSMRRVVVE